MARAHGFRPIVADQYTEARGYFLCLVFVFFCEGLTQLPAYLMTLRKGTGTYLPTSLH
jgi:hypothetical protein